MACLKRVYIYSSDVSALVGRHRWCASQAFERVWRKCDVVHAPPLETVKTKLEKILGARELSTLSRESIQDLPAEAVGLAREYLNTLHGITRETHTLDKFEKHREITLDKSQKLYSKRLFCTKSFDWYVCGKVDGKCSEYIVEAKNRISRFMDPVPEYERVQVHVYMWLLGMSRTMLVEHLNENMRVTDITCDQQFTEKILEELKLSLSRLDEFATGPVQSKMEYLQKSVEERDAFIRNGLNEESVPDENIVCDID